MKFLILFLISFSAMANYIPKSKIGQSGSLTVWLKQSKCEIKEGESCIKIDRDYSPEYSQIIPDTQMKVETETCLDETDCQAKLEAKICDKGVSIKNLDSLEVYCTYLRPEHVDVDQVKKDAHDLKVAKKAARAAKKARGAQARAKCKDALDFIAGGNEDSEMTEEQIDGMQTAFAPIFNALKNNRPGKALRLIKLVDDVQYQDLKNDLIEILE